MMRTPYLHLALALAFVFGTTAGRFIGRAEAPVTTLRPAASAVATVTVEDGYSMALDDCHQALRIARRRCFVPDDLIERVTGALRAEGWQAEPTECEGCDSGFTKLVLRRTDGGAR